MKKISEIFTQTVQEQYKQKNIVEKSLQTIIVKVISTGLLDKNSNKKE